MNNKVLFTLFSCILIGANARFLRTPNLGSSDDFDGADHTEHKFSGDIYHAATDTTSSTGTINYITQDVALNLGLKLPEYIAQQKETMKTQLDTGMTFCGAEYVRIGTHKGVALRDTTQGTYYNNGHGYKDSAAKEDGVVVDTNDITTEDDIGQCGANSCVAGSVVHAVANFIRSQGYHIRHQDICRARSGTSNVEPLINTCNLENVPTTVKAYSCAAAAGVYDQWKYDKECSVFGTTSPGNAGYGNSAGGTQSDCDSETNCEENDSACVATGAFLIASPRNCVVETDNDIVPGGTPAFRNQVKRVLKYGLMDKQEADVESYAYVTGSAVGCTSLRGIVLAINGAKLEHTFVQKQHNAAEDYWQTQIDDTKKIIETIIVKITNLNAINQYFYPLETAPLYQCDSSFAPFESGIDMGDDNGPKCDQAGMDQATFAGQTHTVSMGRRSNCLCRSFKATSTDEHSVDELYLRTSKPTTAICNKYKTTLPSVFTFCDDFAELGDVSNWKSSLARLGANKDDMPTNLDAWYTVSNNNGKTGKDEVATAFDDSIEGSGTQCGRVSSASTTSVSFSNKGGNCIPLQGVEHILYRLEFEFFGVSSVSRKSTGTEYRDIMCTANPDGDQILSFRQLAYQWQRRDANGTYPVEGDTNSDDIDTENGGKGQFYDNSENKYDDMCSVDYAQLLGGGAEKEDAGEKVADPLSFFSRVTGEAAENVQHTFSALNAVASNLDILWGRFQSELTDTKYSTATTGANTDKSLVADIGKAAADHFMSIVVHGDDSQVTSKMAICAAESDFKDDVAAKALKDCTSVTSITTTLGTATTFAVETWGLYGTTNLETASFPVFTSFKDQSLKKTGADLKVSFKLKRYGWTARTIPQTLGPSRLRNLHTMSISLSVVESVISPTKHSVIIAQTCMERNLV